MKSSDSGKLLTVISRVKMKSGSTQDVSNIPVLYSYRNGYGDNKLGVILKTDGKMSSAWDLGASGSITKSVTLSDSAWDFTAARFRSDRATADSVDGEDGTTGYFNGDIYAYGYGCRNYTYNLYGVTIGGAYNNNARNFSNLQTDYVVIFENADESTPYDISAWSLSGMTTVSTDINTTTTTDGVNLPASATLTASATPAAVFVQQNSTLTVTGSGSLNINSGSGPLYIADGTTFTIDATGVTSLTALNPSVTLVSGKIYGTDLITVKVPVVAGCKVTAAITESEITLTCAANSVTFTSPFTGADLSAPTTATGWGNSADEISFGENATFAQTLSTRSAVVADVFAGTYSVVNGLLKAYEAATNADKDSYLMVSGGTASIVNGRQTAPYGATSTKSTTGDSIVQLQGDASVDYVFGSGDQGHGTTLTGNSGVTVKGNAVVKGAIVGGWGSSHQATPVVTGNTAVRIENIQSNNSAGTSSGGVNVCIPNDLVIGGSSLQWNVNGHSTIQGSSSVVVAIAEATGSFAKRIVGGSSSDNSTGDYYGNESVGGNSSVTITAPNVTFPKLIVGGGYANSKAGYSSSVGGNSSVTINSGTYTGTLVAGGYAESGGTSTVAGNATLTLNGGTFSGATISAGTASGTKSLVIGGDVDLSGTTINDSGFDGLSVSATKTLSLGEKRLVRASDLTLTTIGDGGKVSFRLTSAEDAAEHAVLINCSVADMTGKFTILDSTGSDITSSVADKVSVRNGYLIYMDVNAYTVTIGSGETAWDSVSWTLAGSSEAMATAAADVNAEATITLNGGTLVISDGETFAGKLTITGTGTLKFTGNATLTSDLDITIGSGVTLDFSGLTNLTNMGRGDTIISAVAITVGTSSITFPSKWECTYSTSATSFDIEGFNTESDSVSINIVGGAASRSGKRITSGDAGFYPVSNSQWNQIAEKTTTDAVSVSVDVVERLAAGVLTQEAGMVATASAKNAYTSGAATTGANAELMYGYLDDGDSGASITVKNIPYSEYTVFVYMGTDVSSDEKNFRPVTINEISYCGSGSTTVAGSSNWGVYTSARGNVTLAEGSNYLKVIGQTSSTLTVQGSTGNDGYRCGIAGIQIVNTGTRPTIYAATLDGAEGTLLPSGESTGMTKTSVGSWSGSSTAKIILTNPTDVNSTVTIGENINTGSLKIRGAGTVTLAIGDGKTLTINDDKVDLTEFSGTLCVDTTMPYNVFAANSAYQTNNGIVRFLGENLEFTGEASLPFGKIAFNSATLKAAAGNQYIDSTYRTIVVEDGDDVTIDSGVYYTSLNFDVRGGSLRMANTTKFWFGNNSTFTQTGGTVTFDGTGSDFAAGSSSCGIFGYSRSGVVNISGGLFDMSKMPLNLWASSSALNLSGDGQVKVKGIIAHGNSGRTVTVGGSSKLILTGTQGIDTSLASVTLRGGTIELQESATIAKQLTLDASTESTVSVAATKTATLSGGVTGTGTLKLDGAGTIANSTALTNVSAIDFTKGLAVNVDVTLPAGAVLYVGNDDVTIGGAVTQSGTLVIDGSAITSGDPSDTITITASSDTFTVANVSTQNMPGSWMLDTTNSTGTELKLVASEVATVGENSYATIAAAIDAANSGETKTVTLTSNTGDSSTPVTIPAGVAVNFGSYTLTCGTLTVGSGVVVNMANISATKVEGSGTVIYDGTYPPTGLGWTDADNWRGTLVIKSISDKQGLVLNNIGNENSVVRLDGVSDAYFDGSQEAKPTLDLDGSGLTLHYANSDNVVILSKLTGSGPLSITGGSSYGAAVVVKESSLFTGAITLQAGCQQQLIFGDSGSDATTAKIIVNSGKIATVPTGTTWSAAGGFDVNGTLAFDGTGSVGSNVTTSNGSTLDFSGFTGTTPAISGSLTLASGTTIKLPDSANLSTGYQVASSGGSGFINATVQIDVGEPTTENIRFDSGTIYVVSPVQINTNDKTYTVSEVFGTPTATSDYVINVTATATMTVPGTAVRTVTYNFTADGNTITLADGYKVPATTTNLKITDASSLTAGNYTLFQWTTKQVLSAGYGTMSSLDVSGLPSNLSAELVYCVDKIVLRVYDTAAQAAKGTLKIWAYGDSITEGFNLADTCANYRGLLCQKLSLLGFNVETVGCYDKISNAAESSELMPKDPAGQDLPPRWRWHSAKHGSTAGPTSADTRANLIENVDSLCAQVGKPDVVLLHIGVNDLGASKDFTGATMTKEIVFKSWTNVVWHLVNNLPESKIIVSTLLYGNASSASRKSSNAKIKEFNELVRTQMNLAPGAAGAFPSRVILADLNTCFETTETEAAPAGITIDTGIDYLHPDWWGCDQMAEGWLSAITDVSKANFSPDDAFPSATPLVAPTKEQLGAAAKAELATYLPGFRRVCYLEAAHGLLTNLSDAIPYVEKDDTIAANTYTKVGYFVEIVRSDNNAHQWVWVDMDAFGERNLEDVGLPVKNIQQVVTSLHVMSNHRGIETVAADDDSVSGFIEFSPYQLNPNASGVADAPADENNTYDWNDTLLNDYGSFACMQVHRIAPSSGRAAQVLFAYNNWRSAIDYPAELGIGNLSQHFFKVSGKNKSTDWTATSLSSTLNTSKYNVKRIEIWAKPEYTATMSATGNFSGLEFSPTLPTDTSACDLIVNVTANAELTFGSLTAVDTIKFDIDEDVTLTIVDADNLTAGKVIVYGTGTLKIAGSITTDIEVFDDATFAFGSGESLAITGNLTVASGKTLTLAPSTITSGTAVMLTADSVVGDIAFAAPDEANYEYSMSRSGSTFKIVRIPTNPAFSFDGTIGATPTGWFSSWAGEGFDTYLRVGPSSTLPTVYEVTEGKHPYHETVAWTDKDITFSIYADISQVSETGKQMLVGVGRTGEVDNRKFLILYREGASVKFGVWDTGKYSDDGDPTHLVGTAATVTAPVSSGYHLYTATFNHVTGDVKLYLDDSAAATGSAGGAIALATGFQIGSILRGVNHDNWSRCSGDHGLTKGVGMAVAAIRGYDAVLEAEQVAKLVEDFPATDGTQMTFSVQPNASGKTLTVYSSAETVPTSFGPSAGSVVIPSGNTVSVTNLRTYPNGDGGEAINSVTINGTLNVSAVDTVVNDSDAGKGVVLGYWVKSGSANTKTTISVSDGGVLNAQDAYVMIPWSGQVKEAKLEISGGTARVKGLYCNGTAGVVSGQVNLSNGGTLEVATIPAGGRVITKNFGKGTFRITDNATEGRAINFQGDSAENATILDPNGHTLTLEAAAVTGSGYIKIASGTTGTVVFNGGSFTGTVVIDANAAVVQGTIPGTLKSGVADNCVCSVTVEETTTYYPTFDSAISAAGANEITVHNYNDEPLPAHYRVKDGKLVLKPGTIFSVY